MIHFDGPWHRKYLRSQLLWFLCWIALTALVVIAKPSAHGHGTHQQLGLPPCTSVLLFHRKCCGCGLTTSWSHAVRGELVDAWNSNPFGIPLYLMFTFSAWAGMWAYSRSRRSYFGGPVYSRFMQLFIAAFLVFGAWRFIAEEAVPYNESIVWAKFMGK